MMTDKKQLAEKILRRARAAAMVAAPYLAPALARVTIAGLVPETAVFRSMSVDAGWRLYYDPDWVLSKAGNPATEDQANLQEITLAWLHEVTHLLRDHHARRERLQPTDNIRSLVAADLDVNSSIRELTRNKVLPKEWLTPDAFGLPWHKPYEIYYEMLSQQEQEQGQDGGQGGQSNEKEKGQKGQKGKGKDEKGQKQGQGQGGQNNEEQQGQEQGHSGDNAEKGQEEKQGQEQGQGQTGERQCPSGLCGGGSGAGCPHDWEEAAAEASGVSGVTEIEAQAIREEVAREITEWAKRRGNVPAEWLRWAEEVLTPKVDWRKTLNRIVSALASSQRGKKDFTLKTPSRKTPYWAHDPYILPGMREPQVRVTVVVDTSGSISERELAQMVGEVAGIVAAIGDVVKVLSCDAAVHEKTEIAQGRGQRFREKINKALVGGGGTDMRVGVKEALAESPRPDIIIVLTDGETPFPEPADLGGVPIVWGIVGRHRAVAEKIEEVKGLGFRWVVPIEVGDER